MRKSSELLESDFEIINFNKLQLSENLESDFEIINVSVPKLSGNFASPMLIDIVLIILSKLEGVDLARLSMTCWAFRILTQKYFSDSIAKAKKQITIVDEFVNEFENKKAKNDIDNNFLAGIKDLYKAPRNQQVNLAARSLENLLALKIEKEDYRLQDALATYYKFYTSGVEPNIPFLTDVYYKKYLDFLIDRIKKNKTTLDIFYIAIIFSALGANDSITSSKYNRTFGQILLIQMNHLKKIIQNVTNAENRKPEENFLSQLTNFFTFYVDHAKVDVKSKTTNNHNILYHCLTLFPERLEWSHKLIVKHGANANEKNSSGNTILHYLSKSTQDVSKTIRALISKYSADPSFKNNDHKTPLDLAKSEKKGIFSSFFAKKSHPNNIRELEDALQRIKNENTQKIK